MQDMTIAANPGRIPEWTLRDRLRKAREAADMSQTDLGEAMGVARTTVARAEQTGGVRRQTLITWAFATGVPLEWLETGEAPSPGDGDGASVVVRHQGLEPRTRWLGASAGQDGSVTPLRRTA